jgi:hypothetical protein
MVNVIENTRNGSALGRSLDRYVLQVVQHKRPDASVLSIGVVSVVPAIIVSFLERRLGCYIGCIRRRLLDSVSESEG